MPAPEEPPAVRPVQTLMRVHRAIVLGSRRQVAPSFEGGGVTAAAAAGWRLKQAPFSVLTPDAMAATLGVGGTPAVQILGSLSIASLRASTRTQLPGRPLRMAKGSQLLPALPSVATSAYG